MTDDGGTLQALLGELTKLLAPLTGLDTSTAPAFLTSLGLPVTANQAQQLAPNLVTVASATGSVVDLGLQVEAAVSSGQIDQILTKLAAAGSQITNVQHAFAAIANAAAGLNLPGAGPIVADLARRILNLLLAEYLGRTPGLNEALELLGVLNPVDHNVGSIDPSHPFFTEYNFTLNRIAGWLQNPMGQLADLYDWEKPNFDGTKILTAVDRVAGIAGLPVLYDQTASPPVFDLIGITLTPATGGTKGLALQLPDGLAAQAINQQNSRGGLSLTIDKNLPSGTTITFSAAHATINAPGNAALSATVTVSYETLRDSTDPVTLIAIPGGSHVSAEHLTASITAAAGSGGGLQLGLGAQLRNGNLVITMSDADGFIKDILGDLNIQSNFDVDAGYGISSGLYFGGSSTLHVQLPTHVNLGPVDITAITLDVGLSDAAIDTGLSADLKASLGPLVAEVDGIGAEIALSFTPDGSGALGFLDVAAKFQPPNGVGLSVDAGVITGGGFLSIDTARGQYSGALQLVFADFLGLTAVGLIDTKLPDGSPGFSLLIIITADFGAGIQLGFGFTLNKVGGVVGLNRGMAMQALMDGVRTDAIESVMFPTDVIANASKIISDLRTFFPPQNGTFLIGPMAELGWGEPTLATGSLGVIIEIPPGDIAILGVLKVALPADQLAILVLQVNFAGVIEPTKQRLYFFASLYDSHVLFITIEGEMGLLVAWGGDANFVLSVGGFHPEYNPPPLPFPAPQRISVDILNESYARIHADGYFAVTSNSVQFGTHSDYFFGFSACSVSGNSGFDALIQFSPFHFSVQISTSFSVQVFGVGVYGVGIDLQLEGPTPWHAHGTASLSFFFFSIGIGIDFTWGDDRNTTLPPVQVMPILVAEIGKQSNWKAVFAAGTDSLVILRAMTPDESQHVLHPAGTLQISQQAVPLDLVLDKFGNQQPSDANRFSLSVSSPDLAKTRDLQAPFAPSQYKNLDDAAKLSQPGYIPQDSGLELAGAGELYATGTAVCREVRYDVTVIDTHLRRIFLKFQRYAGSLFHYGLRGNAAARCAVSAAVHAQTHPFDGTVAVSAEVFVVAHTDTNTAATAATFTSQASAADHINQVVAANPALAGTLHVLPQFEVAA